MTLSVAVLLFRIPPPLAPPLPLEIVRPEIVTTAGLVAVTLKTRNCGVPPAVLRITVKRLAPGPVIVRFLSISNSADVKVIVLTPAWNVIVAPAHACRIVSRKDPAPLLLLFVTIVGPQPTVIVAVAGLLRPASELLNEACTWNVPFALELLAGVNFNPAFPSATVM